MKNTRLCSWLAAAAISAGSLAGCQQAAPPATQPTDPVGNAIAAASVQRGMTLADLTGGDLGLGGGYLVAAAPEKIRDRRRQDALTAAQQAEQAPVQLKAVHDSDTADLNHDGFITLDEILAMSRAGLSDREIGDRLRATGYSFHLTAEQERYLTDRGVSGNVVDTLHMLSGSKA